MGAPKEFSSTPREQGLPEGLPQAIATVDLLDPVRSFEYQHGDRIRIAGKTLAVDKWRTMLGLTEEDGLERGVTVSARNAKVFVSRIYRGLPQFKDHTGKIVPNRIFEPLLPHGINSLLPMTPILKIHTHPMPEYLDHLQTTFPQDDDIANFIETTNRASVILDRGGAHILIDHRKRAPLESSDDRVMVTIVDAALNRARKEDGSRFQVMQEIARELSRIGIGYYYTEALDAPPDGFVEFDNVLSLEDSADELLAA